jgi:hypothetical protein
VIPWSGISISTESTIATDQQLVPTGISYLTQSAIIRLAGAVSDSAICYDNAYSDKDAVEAARSMRDAVTLYKNLN